MSERSIATPLACLVILFLGTTVASAQVVRRVPVRTVGVANGWYGGGYGSFSSTPLEGAQRGMADVIRSQGEANVNNAEALLTLQDAQSKYLDNELKWAETYWQRRRLTEAENQKDIDKDRARRDAWRNNRDSRTAIATLNPDQLDPSNGRIEWPTVLQGSEFAEYRAKLDELFLTRAQSDAVPGLAQEINQTTLAMKSALKANIREMPSAQYLDARKFIDGLNLANSVS